MNDSQGSGNVNGNGDGNGNVTRLVRKRKFPDRRNLLVDHIYISDKLFLKNFRFLYRALSKFVHCQIIVLLF